MPVLGSAGIADISISVVHSRDTLLDAKQP
jgi:hypothetical protein